MIMPNDEKTCFYCPYYESWGFCIKFNAYVEKDFYCKIIKEEI